jgi:hypothetical protein
MTTLKISSIPGEYYYGDLPGTLQYRKDPALLKALDVPVVDAQDSGYVEISEQCLERMLPVSSTAGKPSDWEQILVMQKIDGDRIWLKAALKNTKSGLIALLTSCNSEKGMTDNGHRAIKAWDDGWFVGHYRMAAPLAFWAALKAAL